MLYIRKMTNLTSCKTSEKTSSHSERGDTIVEVLVAIAILGAVLGSAYVVSNRSVKSNQSSQEHLEAVKLIEGQFEKIKILSSNAPNIYDKDGFCIDSKSVLHETIDTCKFNTLGMTATGDDTPYAIWIRRAAYLSLNGNPQGGTRYKVTVSWPSFTSNGDDKVEQYYEVYK